MGTVKTRWVVAAVDSPLRYCRCAYVVRARAPVCDCECAREREDALCLCDEHESALQTGQTHRLAIQSCGKNTIEYYPLSKRVVCLLLPLSLFLRPTPLVVLDSSVCLSVCPLFTKPLAGWLRSAAVSVTI